MRKKIQIGIADDHMLFREGLKKFLANDDDLEVKAEGESGSALLEKMAYAKIDVVIADVSMPGMDGIELTSIVRRDYPETCVIGLSVHDDVDTIRRMVLAGAKGYILKDAHPDEIIKAVKIVREDRLFFSSGINTKIEGMFSTVPPVESELTLNPKELLLLSLIVGEKNSSEIGKAFGVGIRSVDIQKAALMEKLGVKTTIGLVKYALLNGLVEEQD